MYLAKKTIVRKVMCLSYSTSTSTVGETAQLSVSVHVCQMLATVFSRKTLD